LAAAAMAEATQATPEAGVVAEDLLLLLILLFKKM
jgi:hypothetical protein